MRTPRRWLDRRGDDVGRVLAPELEQVLAEVGLDRPHARALERLVEPDLLGRHRLRLHRPSSRRRDGTPRRCTRSPAPRSAPGTPAAARHELGLEGVQVRVELAIVRARISRARSLSASTSSSSPRRAAGLDIRWPVPMSSIPWTCWSDARTAGAHGEVRHGRPRASAVARWTTGGPPARSPLAAAEVHQATRIGGHERLRPLPDASPSFSSAIATDTSGPADGERAPEAAAQVRPAERHDPRSGCLEQRTAADRRRRAPEHVARVVVGDRPALVPGAQLGAGEEGRELATSNGSTPSSSGRWCATIAAHDPDGVTTGRSRSNAFTNVRATRAAARWCPALKAGWPQQIWPRGKTTSCPAARRSASASATASGRTRSPRHVAKSCTRTVGIYWSRER